MLGEGALHGAAQHALEVARLHGAEGVVAVHDGRDAVTGAERGHGAAHGGDGAGAVGGGDGVGGEGPGVVSLLWWLDLVCFCLVFPFFGRGDGRTRAMTMSR